MTFHCLVALKEAGYLAEPMKVFPESTGGMAGGFVSERSTLSGLCTVFVRCLLRNNHFIEDGTQTEAGYTKISLLLVQSSSGYKDFNL